MLKTRVIPCLDVKDGRVVKGVNFVDIVDAGDPVAQAKFYDKAGADELVFLDISATNENRSPILHVVRETAKQCFMPLTVGGGINDVKHIRKLLLAGADKVSINTAAVYNPNFVKEAADKFGSQCIVVAIDAKAVDKDGNPLPAKDADLGLAHHYEIFTHGGKKATGIDALMWAEKMQALGAGEILLTSMDRDGTKSGYNLPMTKAIADSLDIPVIASGGVGNLEHMVDGVTKGHASAVLAASIFHFGIFSIEETKKYMKDNGINVRI